MPAQGGSRGILVVVADQAAISRLRSNQVRTKDDAFTTVYLSAPADPDAVVQCNPQVLAYFGRSVPGGALAYAARLKARPELQKTLLLAIVPDQFSPTNGEVRRAGIWHVITEEQAFGALFRLIPTAIDLQHKQYESDNPQSMNRSSKPADYWAAAYERSTKRLPVPEFPIPAFSGGDGSEVSGPADVSPSGLRLCGVCRRWKPEPEDRYCAWCAAPLIIPAIDSNELSFTAEGQGAEHILSLRNDGTNALFATLEFRGSSDAVARFSVSPQVPDNLYEIPADGHQAITIKFDGRNINPAFDYSVSLGIDTNAPLESLNVALKVERPPIAVLLPPPLARAVFVCGDRAVLPLAIRNAGGGSLKVSGIQIEQPRAIVGSQACATEIPKDANRDIEGVIDLDKLSAGNYIARGFVVFENHPRMPFTREFRVERPARIRIEPAAVSSDIYPIARRDRQELELQNIGDAPLRIDSVRSNQPWVSPLCKNVQVGPKQRTYVDVFVDGTQLPIGRHSAELEIVSNSYGGPVKVPVYVRVRQLTALNDPIGVDFGTSLSCVATVRDGDPVLVDINPENESESVEGRGLPSVVFFEENFFPIVGEAAKQRAEINPSSSVQSVKRLLGGKHSLKIRGKEFTASQVTVEIFRTLLGAVERSVVDRGSPKNAILTVPADISDEQIREVLDSAATAGLDIDHASSQEYVLDEPSAAALYYLWKSRKRHDRLEEELIFIYDFGAGTLDCSLVSIKRGESSTKIAVLATTGDRRFGGDDVDLAIAQYVARGAQDRDGFDPFPILCSVADLNGLKDREYTQAVELRSNFCRLAEQMKIQLSSAGTAEIEFPFPPSKPAKVKLATKEFHQIMEPFLLRSDTVIAGCCKQAGIKPERVHTILHTGRGSAISILRHRVNAYFPQATDRSAFIEAKQCVAMGAAWWAYIKNLPGTDIQFEGLSPKVPHSIGYRAVENFASVFKPIFEAGRSYPAEKQITFPCRAGRKFELDIVEKRFGLDERIRSRGTVRLPANKADQNYKCIFRLTPQRTLEVLVADHRLEIDPHEDEDTSAL